MKQITYLLFLLISSLSFGQNLTVNGGFENFTGGLPDNWSNESGAIPSQESSIVSEGASAARYSVNTQTQGDTDVRQTIALTNGITYEVSFDAYQLDNQSRVRLFAGDYRGYSDPAILNQWQTVSFLYTATADGDVEFGLRFYDTSDWNGGPSEIIIDNFQVIPQTSPGISIDSPSEGVNLDPITTSVNIDFTTQNFDLTGGNVVEYIVNAGAAQTTTSSPITIAVTSGESYTVTLELKDTGGSLNSQVIETINFSVGSYTNVATIADLRAGTPGEYYILTGEAMVTYTQASRNQKFIEDATAAILIDDDPGIITENYVRGDGITGLTGQLIDFNGTLELQPTIDPGAPSSSGNTITTQEVTLAELSANSENYESELVRVLEVTVDNSVNTNWVIDQVYALTQNTDTFNFRTSFADADYLDQPVQTFPVNITGIITERSGNNYYITARDTNDFEAAITDPILTITGPSADQIFDYATNTVDVTFTTENFDLTGDNFVEYIVNSGSAQTTTTSPITINVMPGTSYTVSLELKDGMGSLNPQVLETITFSTEVAPPSLPIIEQFDYIVGQNLVDQELWENSSTSTDEILISNGNLNYEGLASDVGNSVSFDGSGSDSFLEFIPATSGKVYASFLVRVTDITGFSTFGYFTALRESGGSFGPRVFLRPSTTTNDFEIGVGNGGSTSIYSSEGYSINTDIFIVYSYDIDNETASLWINPVAGESEPTTTLIETATGGITDVASFLIRQDSASETPFMIMDELKLGTSWEAVTEATLSVADFNPQDRSFKFYPNPVKDGVIHFSSDSTENTEIKIFNILGKEMISKKLDGSSINVSNLSQGVYLAQIIVDGQKAATTKIIIR